MEFVRSHEKAPVGFRDILKERHGTSDLMWITRAFQWTKAFKQPKDVKNPAVLQQEVLKSPRILKLIEEEARERNVKPKEVREMVQNILEEVGCSKNLAVVRWLGLVLLKIMKQTVSALYVNEDQLLKMKERMGSNPVVFLPSHRSYADFILMCFVMFNYSIDIPCVAAGMDFHSMRLMGRLLRDCSAFFMRRSFSDDRLYRTVFDEYVKKLVAKGDAPIEFFIEGTRSRSAKSLTPKFGLLTMVMEALYSGEVPDITIVPVNISYDRTLEEVLFAYEMLGVAKPKESTSGLLKAMNMLDEKYGSVYFHFCEPMSAHDYVKRLSGESFSYVERALSREQAQTVLLGHTVVDCQQKHAVLMCFNVLALVLSNHLAVSDTPLELSKAAKDVAWLSSVLSVLGAYVRQDGNTLESVKQAILVHKSLVTIREDRIHLVNVHNPQSIIDPKRIKGYRLGSSTMSLAVPLCMLQQYVNPCMHFIVHPAMITVVLQPLGDTGHISKGDLFEKYRRLRSLLSVEFAFYKDWERKEFEEGLQMLDLVNIIESSQETHVTLGNHKKLRLMLSNLLYPFLSGYLCLSNFLMQQTKPEFLEERAVLSLCQSKIEADLMSGELCSPYTLSLDMISCALQSLTQHQALSRTRINGVVNYKVFHEKLLPIVNELETVVIKPQAQGDPLQLSAKHSLLDPALVRAKL